MGKRGPKRTPTETLQRRGSWLADTRAEQPKPRKQNSTPAAPKYLSKEAKVIWRDMAKRLVNMGVLGDTDLRALGRYCQAYAAWMAACRQMEESGEVTRESMLALEKADNILRRLEASFGMTPADRANMVVGKQDKATDGIAGFINKKLVG